MGYARSPYLPFSLAGFTRMRVAIKCKTTYNQLITELFFSMSDKRQLPTTHKGQKRCTTTKCRKFFSALDLHERCGHCTPRVCNNAQPCVFCALLSEEEWAAWTKQSKLKRKNPPTTVPPKEPLAPPKEPTVVVGLVDKSPGPDPAQNAGNSGPPATPDTVPATPDTSARVSGLEASVGFLRTEMASIFGNCWKKNSHQLEQPHLPYSPANPGGVPDQGQGLATPEYIFGLETFR